jgi:hypothetical protein
LRDRAAIGKKARLRMPDMGRGIIGQLEVGFMQNRQKNRLSFTNFIGFGRGV